MVYEINCFKNWSTFESWTALKEWLLSDIGGKLRVVEPKDSPFAIIRYVKGQSNFSMEHVPWCRSVIVDKASRIPVCVGPPKASVATEDYVNDVVSAEEFVDGSMVNVFRGIDTTDPVIATRSRLGAKARIYGNDLSFEQMFSEALQANNVETSQLLYDIGENHSVFTSVVLQHSKNRIVKKINKNLIQIVHQGHVSKDGTVYIEEDQSKFTVDGLKIQTYNLNAIKGSKTVEAWVTQFAQEKGYEWQGLVLKDNRGKRWRIRSQVYETVRRIRGNETTVEERFARLRHDRSVDQYLSFYPEDREAFYKFEGQVRKNTRNLTQFYIDVFRTKKTPYYELPWPYKHHVSVLHNQFKEQLKTNGKKVNLDYVIQYVNTLGVEDLYNMTKIHNLELKPAVALAQPPSPPPTAVEPVSPPLPVLE
jgi:hypothetical protein